MILVDVNLLLYAKLADLPQHARAHAWFDEQLNGAARVGLPWESLTGFLRVATNPRIFPRPLDPVAAWAQVQEWLALPTVWVPTPTDAHEGVLGRLIQDTRAVAGRVPDAHLAALAITYGLTLCSADADFRVFRGLRLLNPLER